MSVFQQQQDYTELSEYTRKIAVDNSTHARYIYINKFIQHRLQRQCTEVTLDWHGKVNKRLGSVRQTESSAIVLMIN